MNPIYLGILSITKIDIYIMNKLDVEDQLYSLSKRHQENIQRIYKKHIIIQEVSPKKYKKSVIETRKQFEKINADYLALTKKIKLQVIRTQQKESSKDKMLDKYYTKKFIRHRLSDTGVREGRESDDFKMSSPLRKIIDESNETCDKKD